MPKPVSRILVIEDDPLVLRELVKGLNAAARSLDNPLGIVFGGVATAREVLDDKERVNRRLSGRVCADGIVPYPPGIPVLVSGQLITPRITEYLASLLRSHRRTELHGIVHEGYAPCVRVLRPGEEKSLKRIG